MTKRDGGSAFPALDYYAKPDGSGGVPVSAGGMTLRDYFAAQALIAIGINYGDEHFGKPTFTEEAKRAYEAADAMLAEREK